MMNEMNKVQVYSVIGGWHYEGEDFASLQLFDCKSTAEQYHKSLTEDEGFDYALIHIQTINMNSVIAA